jgi:uncharacterized membrane protein YfcA
MSWELAFIVTAAISFVCGAISAMGIGGGAILLIYMTLIMNMGQVESQYINLIYFVPTAAVAIIVHFKNKLISLRAGVIAASFGIIGVAFGVYAATAIDPYWLRKLFGVLLLYIGVTQLINTRKAKQKK